MLNYFLVRVCFFVRGTWEARRPISGILQFRFLTPNESYQQFHEEIMAAFERATSMPNV